MDKTRLILISGRSTKQGTGISTGKEGPEYQEATNAVEMNLSDMLHFGLHDGDSVVLKSEFGEASVKCFKGDMPEGLAFIPFGPACNRLVGDETYASGMPDSKHLEVEIKPLLF
ncbi:MAG: formylmethanofuran dehydrogenase [Acidobacteria bacterium]|nr:formylmethanofuran dehydrogenase [Acidobacteriota bacterium]